VTDLVDELRGTGLPRRVGSRDSLERDLGISSLERVELLVRLERAFGVRLGDTAMADALTPHDLAITIENADPNVVDDLPRLQVESTAATPAPPSARTIVEALAWHAERTPDRISIHLHKDEGQQPLTYGWLWHQSSRVAAGLVARGLRPRDTVAIMLRTEPAFFPSFFGTLMASCVPVPLYPPFRTDRVEEYAQRQVGILRNADARLMITFAEIERIAGLVVNRVPSLETVVTMDVLAADATFRPRRFTAGDPALIQYTSGSTGHPKGVLLSHANLLANIRSIQRALSIGSDDVGVSWLPLYHDMGLIGAWLGTMYFGTPLALMSPLAFLARPARWLWALHTHRGTMSPAPNFAYDLCVHRVIDDEIAGLDLSSVRVLLNGSETVVPDTLERFNRRFAPYGLNAGAVAPVYGLAECAVGLAMPPVGRSPRFDRVARGVFEKRGRAEPATLDDISALRFVSCGRALPDHELRVVDDNGSIVGERHEGHVRFRGPSATAGYYRNPEATRALVSADGWLETGDLGYIADGELFLTGRRKDLIIKGGRNIHPHEAEEIVGNIDGVRKGCVAAFGVADPDRGSERFVLVAETRATASDEREQIRSEIISRSSDMLGLPPDVVILSPPASILKTSSGKIRRGATRDEFLAGRLTRGRRPVLIQWSRLFTQAVIGALGHWTGWLARVVFTAYVVTVFLVTGLVIWSAMALGPRGRWVDRLVGRWTRILFTLAGCHVEVIGLDHLRGVGPVVFVGNHTSYADPPLMISVLPTRIRFAAKARLATYPFLGLAIRKAGHVTIEKADQSKLVESASDILAPLRAGESLFVFPEGTFVAEPGLLPFRLGAFRAAADSDCPVVPVSIRGMRDIFPAGTWLLRPGRVTVTIGKPIRSRNQDWSEMVRMRDEARAVIARETGED